MKDCKMKDSKVFEEKQRFKQWWIWLSILLFGLVISYGAIRQLVFHKNFGENPLGNSGLLTLLISYVLAVSLFLFLRLETKIDHTGIHYRFFPFHMKMRSIVWKEIEYFEIRTYEAIWEYGAWGIKGFRDNRAYNVSGNQGLQLLLKNKRRILLGSQKISEIEDFLKNRSLKH